MKAQQPSCPECAVALYGADLEIIEDAFGGNAPDLGAVARELKDTGVRHLRMLQDMAKVTISRGTYKNPIVYSCPSCSSYYAQCGSRCGELWQLQQVPKLYEQLTCPGCGAKGAADVEAD